MPKSPEIMGEIEKEITREKYGRNIFQRDIYYRHGKKLPTGELAPEGFEQARVIGKQLKATVKPYVSEIKRTEDFAKAIQEATENGKEYKVRTRHEISITKEGKKLSSTNFIEQWRRLQKEKGEDAALQWVLDFDKKRPDPDTLSPYEIAAKFARHVLTHVKMPERYYSGSEVEMINVSHTWLLEFFLSYALKEQIEKDPVNPESKTFIEKMGGAFAPGESFEIDTIIDNKGNKTLKVKLRGKKYNLSEEKLKELASAAKGL